MKMKTEKKQLLNRKLEANCGAFAAENEDSLKKWMLTFVQMYSQANVNSRNIEIKWEGDMDDSVIKIKLKEGDNTEIH